MTASPPSRTPAQPESARTALRYALVVTAGLVLLLVLVAGCGAAPLPPAAPSTIAPTTPAPPPPPTTTTAPPTTTTTEPTTRKPEGTPAPAPHAAPKKGTAGPVPIWPATDTVSARRLQDQVDGGRQPWLLDPSEVAVSYAGSELGYRNPGVFTIAPGRVDIQDGKTPRKATITLGQTVRRGDGGIWLVTAVRNR